MTTVSTGWVQKNGNQKKNELVHSTSGMSKKGKNETLKLKQKKGDYPGVIQSVYPIQESCL